MFRRNTRANPGIGEAWAGLGLTYLLASKDVGEGIEALEKARRLLPAREDIALNLATLYARGGARDRARALVDTVLSRSADPAVRSGGSEVLFRGDLEEAAALLDAGRADEALRRLRALREATADPALRGEVDTHLRTIEATMETNRHIALFNTALERANRQDYAGAVPLLEQVVAQASDPGLKTEAQTLLSRLRQTLLFNRAVRTANAGDPRGAAALLRQLLREPVDPEIGRRARALLRDLEESGG
jgi:tetratricopeptide (TPR) repeat protein